VFLVFSRGKSFGHVFGFHIGLTHYDPVLFGRLDACEDFYSIGGVEMTFGLKDKGGEEWAGGKPRHSSARDGSSL
jgi:hypothetical protein